MIRTPIAAPPPGVTAIVAIDVIVFAWEAAIASSVRIDAFAAVPYNIVHGVVLVQPSSPLPALTLVSALFEHASAAHLAINLAFFLAFAPAVERLLGTSTFVCCYLLCGVVGTLAQIALDPSSHVPIVGASGAIAGILGVHLARLPTKGILGTPVPAVAAIAAWVAAQAAGQQTDVAYASHLGGFAAGAFLGEMMRG